MVPPNPVLEEILPLLIKLCSDKLAVLQQPAAQPAQEPQQQQAQLQAVARFTLHSWVKELVVVIRCSLAVEAVGDDNQAHVEASPLLPAATAAAASSSSTDVLRATASMAPREAFLPHANAILSILEGFSRDAAAASSSDSPERLNCEWLGELMHLGFAGDWGRAPLLLLALEASPQSGVWLHVYSLLGSLFKLSAAASGIHSGCQLLSDDQLQANTSMAAALLAVDMLRWAVPDTGHSTTTQQDTPLSAAAAASAEQHQHTSAVDLLPCLVIIGRCCLQ